jgi:hypothetical protein
MVPRKKNWATLHHKGLEPKYVPRERGQIIWAIIPTQKISRGTTFNKGGPQRGKPQMLETKKVALCHQGKSCLCRGWIVRRWFCATKTNYDCAADGMLEGGFCATKANYDCTTDGTLEDGFVLSRQVMFVPRMVCKIMVLQHLGKSYFGRGPNVRKLPWGTKTNHVVAVN